MERLPGEKKIPASLLWNWLDTHVQAIAHPSRGMKLTQPRQQRYACAAPKTFVVPFSFQSSFTQQASFFSPGPCFHFTANTIWFGFHNIPPSPPPLIPTRVTIRMGVTGAIASVEFWQCVHCSCHTVLTN